MGRDIAARIATLLEKRGYNPKILIDNVIQTKPIQYVVVFDYENTDPLGKLPKTEVITSKTRIDELWWLT